MKYAQKRLTNRTDVFKFLCAGVGQRMKVFSFQNISIFYTWFFRIIFPKKTAEKIIPIKSEAAQARKNVLKNTVRWLTSCHLMFSYGQNADF